MAKCAKVGLSCTLVLLLAIAVSSVACLPANSQQKNAVQAPVVVAKPDRLSFTMDPANPSALEQVISVANVGGGVLNWSMSDNAHWIILEQLPDTSGLKSGTVKVVIDVSGLDPGEYTGVITIAAEGAVNSPVYMPVHLTLMGAASRQPVTIQTPQSSQGLLPPGNSSVVWNNQNDFYKYSGVNACVVSGSITNTDKRWNLTDVSIAAKSGSSVNIANVIPPGETVMYYRFIPCFQREDVTLQYKWQNP